jgi:hypothetical protein
MITEKPPWGVFIKLLYCIESTIPVSGAYIFLDIQVVPHARKSLGVRVITDSYTST